uniref:Uncharacterized protein n=1 Tax=Phaeodactylum tricornutum TaxID=2850 RepID=A0A8J9X1G5_PHATR
MAIPMQFGKPSERSGTMEHCQTMIMDRNLSQHRNRGINSGTVTPSMGGISRNASYSSDTAPLLQRSGSSIPSILEYESTNNRSSQNPTERPTITEATNTIRFQVIVWYVGKIDMVEGRVPITFRVTIYWNALDEVDEEEQVHDDETSASTLSRRPAWQMHGRQKAFVKELKDVPSQTVEVPPVSILNVVTFDTIGSPEVSLLQEDTRLMRWTCMYRATLIQEHWRVDDFPHDEHEISLRMAVLAHRQPGSQWDRRIWKLSLATADDSQGSVRVPYGLVVDQVSIPEFSYNKNDGLSFAFEPLDHGPGGNIDRDTCLEVKLKVLRDSSYYDRNIMPLLGLLNFVAISITALEAQNFFERALLTLNITFVEIGMRMTADSKLPSASYQIKMQRILNEYFYGLLVLVLESLFVYELHNYGFRGTGVVDAIAALAVFSHNAYTLFTYYSDAATAQKKFFQIKQEKV